MSHNWDDTHYESVNCKVRQWRNGMDARGWKRAKFSWRGTFDVLHTPYEISPNTPQQGQALYVNAEVHKTLTRSRVFMDTFAGRVQIQRPKWLIEKWLREAAL